MYIYECPYCKNRMENSKIFVQIVVLRMENLRGFICRMMKLREIDVLASVHRRMGISEQEI